MPAPFRGVEAGVLAGDDPAAATAAAAAAAAARAAARLALRAAVRAAVLAAAFHSRYTAALRSTEELSWSAAFRNQGASATISSAVQPPRLRLTRDWMTRSAVTSAAARAADTGWASA